MSKANALRLSAAMAAAALAGLFLILGLGLPAAQLKKGLARTQEERPNIVFVLTDDLDSNSMKYLGGLRNIMGHNGTTFEKAYVSKSLCCPSRVTILRGQYPHNHGIRSNVPPSGGHDKFRSTGKDQSTVATWLNDAGYQTKFIGKYMNGYNERYVPPGWDEWFGWLGEYKSQKVNDNGMVLRVQGHDTDLFASKAVDFIRRASAKPEPFFLSVWTRAPHQPAISAPRYADRFKDTPLPRPPGFNEKGVSDKPRFIQEKPLLTDGKIANMRRLHQKRLGSMLSVEDLLEEVLAALRETGEYGNTYIFFTSDNGYHLGQHRMTQGKRSAYEEDIRVPFMVRGPGVPAGGVLEHLVLNNDFAPTFADLAGVTPPSFVDGTSLIPLLDTNPPTVKNWRTGILTENWRTEAEGETSDAPNYKALRTKSFLLVRYANGERELYDMRQDPYQLHSRDLEENRRLVHKLNNQLDRLVTCHGVECRATEAR
jgi:N-acetylglucosamine-6-sulfatase